MAKTKRRRRHSSHASAGTRHSRRRSNTGRRHHRRRSNPGGAFGSPKDWLSGGAGVLTGVVATRGLPQLVLGSSNTGVMGYAANAVATAISTFAAHMLMKGNRVFTSAVLAGGVAALISRVIGDYSLLGSYSANVGLGDYLFNFNWPVPQYLQPGNTRALGPGSAGGAMPVNLNSPASAGVSGFGAQLY